MSTVSICNFLKTPGSLNKHDDFGETVAHQVFVAISSQYETCRILVFPLAVNVYNLEIKSSRKKKDF